MKQKRLFLLSGIPGSGKSTWVKNQIEAKGGIWISRDTIRFSVVKEDEEYFGREDEVFATFISTIQEQINNLDINDYETYDKLSAEFDQALIDAIEPFEKAFAATSDKELQLAIADGLKQIYFRFRDKDPKYQAGYEKYNSFLEANGE